jgi:hypothetical protein
MTASSLFENICEEEMKKSVLTSSGFRRSQQDWPRLPLFSLAPPQGKLQHITNDERSLSSVEIGSTSKRDGRKGVIQ